METIAKLASWFQATNVTAIVRIHKSFAHLIPGILDQGIMGIQVSEGLGVSPGPSGILPPLVKTSSRCAG